MSVTRVSVLLGKGASSGAKELPFHLGDRSAGCYLAGGFVGIRHLVQREAQIGDRRPRRLQAGFDGKGS